MEANTEVTHEAYPNAEIAGEAAPKAKKVRRKSAEVETAATPAKEAASLDDVMELLDKQDDALKLLAAQAKDMLAANAAVRRAVRQVVKDASRRDEVAAELDRFKKRWANLKSLVS